MTALSVSLNVWSTQNNLRTTRVIARRGWSVTQLADLTVSLASGSTQTVSIKGRLVLEWASAIPLDITLMSDSGGTLLLPNTSSPVVLPTTIKEIALTNLTKAPVDVHVISG